MRKVQSKFENPQRLATVWKFHAYEKRSESPGYENLVCTKYSGFTIVKEGENFFSYSFSTLILRKIFLFPSWCLSVRDIALLANVSVFFSLFLCSSFEASIT